MKAIVLQKSSQIQCGRASIFDVTTPKRAWGTLLAPARFHNRSLAAADPHTWQAPAQNAALLEESTRIGLVPSEWTQRGECPENGALEPLSHGTFLHVARQTRRQPSQFHYISRNQPNAHELTYHIRHPSPEPGLPSPGAPGKWWHRWCGIVPVSSTGTTSSFPRILWISITYRIGFCGWARIQLVNQLIPTNQNKFNKVNNLNNLNNLHNLHNDNNLIRQRYKQ